MSKIDKFDHVLFSFEYKGKTYKCVRASYTYDSGNPTYTYASYVGDIVQNPLSPNLYFGSINNINEGTMGSITLKFEGNKFVLTNTSFKQADTLKELVGVLNNVSENVIPSDNLTINGSLLEGNGDTDPIEGKTIVAYDYKVNLSISSLSYSVNSSPKSTLKDQLVIVKGLGTNLDRLCITATEQTSSVWYTNSTSDLPPGFILIDKPTKISTVGKALASLLSDSVTPFTLDTATNGIKDLQDTILNDTYGFVINNQLNSLSAVTFNLTATSYEMKYSIDSTIHPIKFIINDIEQTKYFLMVVYSKWYTDETTKMLISKTYIIPLDSDQKVNSYSRTVKQGTLDTTIKPFKVTDNILFNPDSSFTLSATNEEVKTYSKKNMMSTISPIPMIEGYNQSIKNDFPFNDYTKGGTIIYTYLNTIYFNITVSVAVVAIGVGVYLLI